MTKLPEAVGIQVERVANSIEELKAAKENEKFVNELIEVFKETGLLAGTPVIFAGKYVIDNWYILLLLLLLLSKLGIVKPTNPSLNNGIPQPEGAPAVVPEASLEEIKEQLKQKFPEMYPRAVRILEKLGRPIELPNPESFGQNRLPEVGIEAIKESLKNKVPEFVPRVVKDAEMLGNPLQMPSPEAFAPNQLPEKIREIVNTPEFQEFMRQSRESGTRGVDLNAVYEALRSLVPPDLKANLFNTFDEAVNHFVEMGYPIEQAKETVLNPDFGIRWLVGPNGVIDEATVDQVTSMSKEELARFLEVNRYEVEQFNNLGPSFNGDLSSMFKKLSAAGVIALLAKLILENPLLILAPI